MSLFLLFQQCPTCLVRLIWMVLEMGGRWLYSYYFVGCCCQDWLNMTCTILVQFPSSFFSICLASIHVVHSYSRIDITAAWRKLHFILSDRFDFCMIDNLSIVVYDFASCISMSFSVDEILLWRYVNLSTNFRGPPFSVAMSPFWLKHIYLILSEFTWRTMLPAASSRLCSWDSTWVTAGITQFSQETTAIHLQGWHLLIR